MVGVTLETDNSRQLVSNCFALHLRFFIWLICSVISQPVSLVRLLVPESALLIIFSLVEEYLLQINMYIKLKEGLSRNNGGGCFIYPAL